MLCSALAICHPSVNRRRHLAHQRHTDTSTRACRTCVSVPSIRVDSCAFAKQRVRPAMQAPSPRANVSTGALDTCTVEPPSAAASSETLAACMATAAQMSPRSSAEGAAAGAACTMTPDVRAMQAPPVPLSPMAFAVRTQDAGCAARRVSDSDRASASASARPPSGAQPPQGIPPQHPELVCLHGRRTPRCAPRCRVSCAAGDSALCCVLCRVLSITAAPYGHATALATWT